ncbi:hypothetical protein bcCo53_001130 (plasmid) [Borrelia coriaceae]|nr:CRASP family complement regulator-acquiring lipoprotein [Borrelia coriaceae]UPA16962.1 hypothetical protein bcCo53_001130 [Borrelia coriaceae]
MTIKIGMKIITQFGMHDDKSKNKAFDILQKDAKPYSHADNKNERRKIYLSLGYHGPSITSLGLILNKLAENATTNPQPNQQYTILKHIVEGVSNFATDYFETALRPLCNKKNKLKDLSLNALNLLVQKLNELENTKSTIRNLSDEMQNKFKDHSIDQQSQLISHINSKRQEFQTSFTKIKTLLEKSKQS